MSGTYFENKVLFYFLSATKLFVWRLSALPVAVIAWEGLSKLEQDMHTARLVLQDPSPETLLCKLKTTHIDTVISRDTDI